MYKADSSKLLSISIKRHCAQKTGIIATLNTISIKWIQKFVSPEDRFEAEIF